MFLSYAREDAKVAKRVADRLEREGRDVWWDQDLYAGTRWEEEILGALEAALQRADEPGAAAPVVRRLTSSRSRTCRSARRAGSPTR